MAVDADDKPFTNSTSWNPAGSPVAARPRCGGQQVATSKATNAIRHRVRTRCPNGVGRLGLLDEETGVSLPNGRSGRAAARCIPRAVGTKRAGLVSRTAQIRRVPDSYVRTEHPRNGQECKRVETPSYALARYAQATWPTSNVSARLLRQPSPRHGRRPEYWSARSFPRGTHTRGSGLQFA